MVFWPIMPFWHRPTRLPEEQTVHDEPEGPVHFAVFQRSVDEGTALCGYIHRQ